MRLLNKYPMARRAIGITVPARTLNYYPLMSKLAEPAPPDPDIQRRITENSVPSARSDQFADWQAKNQGQNYDQYKQQYLQNAKPYTGATDGQMYKAPTAFTGNIDSDINTEMSRLKAENPNIYNASDGDAFLRRRATQNVFDANPNMDYNDLSGNIADQYDNTNQGSQDKGTQALADKMKFHQDTGPEQFGWTSPSTWGIPRFTRNLFTPSEWSTRDFAAADTALNAAQFGVSLANPALAPLLAASKGVGAMYGKARNNMYDSRDGFQWGELGMDALRGGVNTALSSIGAGNNTGALGNVFRPLDQVTSRVGKYVTDKVVGAPINLAAKGYDYARRSINPMYGYLSGGVSRPLGRFFAPQGYHAPFDPAQSMMHNLTLPAWDRLKAGIGTVGGAINNRLVAPVISKVVPNIRNLRGSALSGIEQYLTRGAAEQAEGALASTGVNKIRNYFLPRYEQEQARNSTGGLPANQQFAQNQPKPVNTQPVNNMPRFDGQQQANNMPKPVNQPQFNRARG